MKIKHNYLKTLVFSLGLAAMTLTATNLNAQNHSTSSWTGGLFERGMTPDNAEYSNSRGLINSSTSTGITNDDFGAPLGSGIAILIGAGLGYVALKKKEDEQ